LVIPFQGLYSFIHFKLYSHLGQEGRSITLFSPPATVDPSVIVTPDEEHKYSHVSVILALPVI